MNVTYGDLENIFFITYKCKFFGYFSSLICILHFFFSYSFFVIVQMNITYDDLKNIFYHFINGGLSLQQSFLLSHIF